MKSCICRCLLLVALVVPFSGCPIPSVSTGVWVFDVELLGPVGLTLLDGGQTETPSSLPPGAIFNLNGTQTWSQDGRTFTMIEPGVNIVTYTGTVNSSTTIIDGTSDFGAWSAVRL